MRMAPHQLLPSNPSNPRGRQSACSGWPGWAPSIAGPRARCDSRWPLPDQGVLLMPLSLPAGSGKAPYQFTTLGQATTEFSKPLDGSGRFKNNPGTGLCSLPFSLPQQGRWDTLWGSLPLLGHPGPPPQSCWKRDASPLPWHHP